MAHRGRPAKLMCDCPNLYSPHEVRKAVLCPRLSTSNPENRNIPPVLSVDYDKPECTSGTCNFCSEMKLFKICEAELALTRPITFLLESRVEYQTNKKDYDGKWIVKNKVDFVSTTMSITDFMDELKGKMLKFIPHHVDMKWQSRDWRWVKKNFPRGTWACVQDFSENFTVQDYVLCPFKVNLFVTNLRIMLILFCTYYREGDYCCNVLCDEARSVVSWQNC